MTPLGLVAIAGALISAVGYWRHHPRRLRARLQLTGSMASWALLWFATGSRFATWGMMSLPIHMIGHVLVMFIVPIGLIVSGTLRGWGWALPVERRRRLTRWWNVSRRVRAPKWLAHPVTAGLVLNVVMVTSHVPRVFDAVMTHDWAMQWLMEPAFLLSGLFFFHFIVVAQPRENHVHLRYQLGIVVVTMLEMLVVAMSMALFTRSPWYSVMVPGGAMADMPGMANMPGMATSVASAFHDQQLAAAILWICGDFWAVPCLVLIVRRLIARDGGFLATLERQTSRLSASA